MMRRVIKDPVTRKWAGQLAAFVLLACLGLAISHGTDLQDDLTPEGVRAWSEALGPLGPLLLILFGLLAPQALIPRWPLAFVCGLLYGVVAGSLLATAASLGGAMIQFHLAGGLLAGAAARLRTRFPLLQRVSLTGPRGFWTLLTLRAFPFSNFVATNLVAGSIGMKQRSFALASFLGMLPSSFMYAAWGKLMKKPDDRFYLLAVGLILLFSAGAWYAQNQWLPRLQTSSHDDA